MPEEYYWLRSQGIVLYQGYLFARPMPFDSLTRYLQEQTPATTSSR